MPSYKRVALFTPSSQRNTDETNLIHGTTAPSTMANLTTISLSSTSSLCIKPNSSFNLRYSFPKSTSRTIITSMAAATATKVIPSIIVGGGRVGKALQDMGGGGDLLVKRGEAVPIDFPGPILVCTRNDDLDAVLKSTPQSRWSVNDIVIVRTDEWCSVNGDGLTQIIELTLEGASFNCCFPHMN